MREAAGYKDSLTDSFESHRSNWLGQAFTLIFQPSRFFVNESIYLARYALFMATFLYTAARVINRIDKQLGQAEFGGRDSQALAFDSMGVLDSWGTYWGFILIVALISTPLTWLIGGWWYGLRVRWSGARNQDGTIIRGVYVYSALVESVPVVLVTIVNTLLHANYRTYYASDASWELLVLLFPFWALFLSYYGVRAVFPVTLWKARLWFLLVPLVLYCIGFIGLITAMLMIE